MGPVYIRASSELFCRPGDSVRCRRLLPGRLRTALRSTAQADQPLLLLDGKVRPQH